MKATSTITVTCGRCGRPHEWPVNGLLKTERAINYLKASKPLCPRCEKKAGGKFTGGIILTDEL